MTPFDRRRENLDTLPWWLEVVDWIRVLITAVIVGAIVGGVAANLFPR